MSIIINKMRRLLILPATAIALGTNYDYCSIKHSSAALTELNDYFLEVFNGFDVPLSAACPFVSLSDAETYYNLKTFESRRQAGG
jgi:hypothetical protein